MAYDYGIDIVISIISSFLLYLHLIVKCQVFRVVRTLRNISNGKYSAKEFIHK